MIENHPLVVADDLSIDAAYWQWARRLGLGRASALVPAPPIPSNTSVKATTCS